LLDRVEHCQKRAHRAMRQVGTMNRLGGREMRRTTKGRRAAAPARERQIPGVWSLQGQVFWEAPVLLLSFWASGRPESPFSPCGRKGVGGMRGKSAHSHVRSSTNGLAPSGNAGKPSNRRERRIDRQIGFTAYHRSLALPGIVSVCDTAQTSLLGQAADRQ